MKVQTVFSALIAMLTLALTNNVLAQDTNQQELDEMRATIERLQNEISQIKQARPTALPGTELPATPMNRQTVVPSRMESSPSIPYQNPDSRFHSFRPETGPVHGYHPGYQHAYPPQPVIASVYAQPVFVEPPCVYGRSGFYVSPGGWGFGVGGLNFHF